MIKWPTKRRVLNAYNKNPLDTVGLYSDDHLREFMLSCSQDDNYVTQGKLFDIFYSSYPDKKEDKPLSVLEVACGVAPALRAIMDKGVKANLIGLDEQKCFETNDFTFIPASMADINTINSNIKKKSIDWATITWCSLGYLPYDQIIAHIMCIYDLLKPNGCYYIGLGDYTTLARDTVADEPWWEDCHSKYGGYGCEFLGEINPSTGTREVYLCWTDSKFKTIKVAKQLATVIVPLAVDVLLKCVYGSDKVHCYGLYADTHTSDENYIKCSIDDPRLDVLVIEKKEVRR